MPLSWLLSTVFAVAPPASEAYELTWMGPEPCDAGEDVRAEIDRLLGDRTADADQLGRVEALATVEPRVGEDAGWHLELELRTGEVTGRRRLDAARCDDLVQATALIVAIAIDPNVALEAGGRPEPAEEGDEPDPAPAPPETPAAPSPAAAPRPEIAPSIEGHLRIGLGPAWGLVPGWTATVAAAGGVHRRFWRIDLIVNAHLPRETDSERNPSVGGRFWAWTAGVAGCGVPPPVGARASVRFLACAGLDAGLVHGVGTGALESRRDTAPWVGARAGPSVVWTPSRRLGLYLATDLVVGIERPRFRTDPSGFLYGPAQIGFLAGLGVEFDFAPAE